MFIVTSYRQDTAPNSSARLDLIRQNEFSLTLELKRIQANTFFLD